MNEPIEYFSYNSFQKKGYNIKSLLCKKLKIKDIQFNTLKDISEFSILFAKHINYCNLGVIEKPCLNNIEEIVECIENDGGICSHLNIIWGLLFTELGIESKLIACVENCENLHFRAFKYHIGGNIFKWSDDKLYLFDISLGINNFYSPILISNGSSIQNYCSNIHENHYRIIKNTNINSNYIIQSNYSHSDINNIEYINLYEFNLESNLTWNRIHEICIEYREFCSKIPLVFKLSNEGYIHYVNEVFSIQSKTNKKITTYINNKQQLQQIMMKYFNININKYTFFNNHEFKIKDTISLYETNKK